MIWYIVNLIIILATWFVLKKIKVKDWKTVFLKIAFVEMAMFLGLRGTDVGVDLKNYLPYFEWYRDLPWNELSLLNLEMRICDI